MVKPEEKDPQMLLKQFDPTPDPSLYKKYDFFYKPYNYKLNHAKHMNFHDESKDPIAV